MTWQEIHDLYDITNVDFRPNIRPNYNIAPTHVVPVVRSGGNGPELAMMRWGFEEAWAKSSIINATAEKVATSRVFKKSFEARRCLVPSDGFYEWKKDPDGKRRPFRICMSDESPFAFAGIWRVWTADKDSKDFASGDEVETFAIITTSANALTKTIHNRMPVILDRADYAGWLGDGGPAFLRPFPAERMIAYEVGTRVNSVRNNDPDCLTPLS
jgi:putative SOS response-associated peptidase YedK